MFLASSNVILTPSILLHFKLQRFMGGLIGRLRLIKTQNCENFQRNWTKRNEATCLSNNYFSSVQQRQIFSFRLSKKKGTFMLRVVFVNFRLFNWPL